ncbi:hypothetical protein FACUT_12110, partial [Fusarium acutatum]
MSNTCVAIDPNGDTLVILATKQDPPLSKESTEPAGTTEPPTLIEKHFLCSQKHLTLASRRASKLFSSAFKEASKQDDGLYHWNFGDVFNVQAFEPASPPASQSNTATTQSTSSLFGGSGFSGFTTSTTAQNTSDTGPAYGGDFGTPRVDSRGFGTSTTTRTTGGLFDTSTAPQPTFAAAAATGGLFGRRTVPQTSDSFSSDPAKNE